MRPDQINTLIIGFASLCVAGLSFIYATKAQAATRRAEAARSRAGELAIDVGAYQRARDLYESGIKTLQEQNDSLVDQVRSLQAEGRVQAQYLRELAERISTLEGALRAASIPVPPWPKAGQ